MQSLQAFAHTQEVISLCSFHNRLNTGHTKYLSVHAVAFNITNNTVARKINDTRHLKQNNDIIICRKTLGHFVVVVVKKAGSHTESVYSKMYCGYGASLQQDVLWLSSQFTTRCTVVMEPVCSKMYCDDKYCSFLLQPRINVFPFPMC